MRNVIDTRVTFEKSNVSAPLVADSALEKEAWWILSLREKR